jgi:predicted unusual protein kinase regulating ubiquinone biosynthesis (AarF/ABC1/UbiB family)
MEYVRGSKITELSPLLRLELDGGRLCKEVLRAYLKQVLVDGLFHADPHPGNVLVTDGCQVALIDLGMVGHVSAEMQENLLKLVLALSEGRGEDAADIVVRAGTKFDEFDEGSFRRQVSKLVAARQNQALRQLNIGQSMLDMTGHARDCGLRVPSELTLLGKTLLQLDEVGRVLDPTFDPAACIREYTTELMKGRMRKEFTQVNVFNALLELKQLATTLPRRINRLVDTLVNSEFEVKFKAVDAAELLQGMQKIANRITTGVVLASLIIGASLLMRVETKFTLWGYPGLAILCFVSAAAGGFWLVLSILIKDHETRKKTQR